MKKLVFSGCSFTSGAGWREQDVTADAKDSPHLWTNLCANNIAGLQRLEVINLGISGASNVEIFRCAVSIMAELGSDINTLFCQWTSMPRYNFNVGFELWDTSESFNTVHRTHEVNLNNGESYPRAYIKDLLDRLRSLHHLHWEILQVVEFSHTIKRLAQNLDIDHVWFVNGLCPWDENYFLRLDNVLPEAYTDFTKKEILNIDTRNDEDILALYQQAHKHYQNAGGIDSQHWINLYDSFLTCRIDRNHDGLHPGILSNQKYFNLVSQRLQ